MTNNKNVPDWAWDFYQAKQEEALNHPTDVAEEILNFLERLFTAGDLPETLSALEQKVDNYLAGYRQKSRRRIRLLENNAEIVVPFAPITNQTWDRVDNVRRNVTLSQWNLLTGLANGYSYQLLSADCKISVASVKSTVCRIRKKLRTQAFAE